MELSRNQYEKILCRICNLEEEVAQLFEENLKPITFYCPDCEYVMKPNKFVQYVECSICNRLMEKRIINHS